MFGNKTIVARLLKTAAVALALQGALLMSDVRHSAGLFATPAQAQESRTIRLALHKSAIIHLPPGVKDVLVGNAEVAEVVLRSKRTMYLFARKLGSTNIFLLDAAGRPLAQLDLSVVINPKALQQLLKKTLPDADIRVEPMENQILLSGTAKTPADVNKAVQIAQNYAKSIGAQMLVNKGSGSSGMQVVNAIRVTGKDQVMIKVKLAEVQRDIFKQLRTNFHRVSVMSGPFTFLTGLLNPFLTNFATGASAETLTMGGLAAPFSLGTNMGEYGLTGIYNKGNTYVDSVVQLMERDGLMRLLAEPTLTAISGEAAKFLAGGEVPVIAGYDPTTKTYTYKLKEIGVLLGFTPLVLSESRISLKVNVEVSEISGKYAMRVGDYTMPGFEKRQATTTVEMPSGGTLAIAGMFRQQTKKNIDGVPGLKNVPILGALFRSRDFQSNQSELVVLATPYIVSPRNEKKFRTPVDGLNIASDYQNYFLGRLNRVYGAGKGPRDATRKVYHGDVGFILE